MVEAKGFPVDYFPLFVLLLPDTSLTALSYPYLLQTLLQDSKLHKK
jgi:hypothetical protein